MRPLIQDNTRASHVLVLFVRGTASINPMLSILGDWVWVSFEIKRDEFMLDSYRFSISAQYLLLVF